MKPTIKTASDLRYYVEQSNKESYFFDRKTMRFFGDTMRNYGVRKVSILAMYDAQGNYHDNGIEREVYELFRRRAVKHGNKKSAYFDAETFKLVHYIR